MATGIPLNLRKLERELRASLERAKLRDLEAERPLKLQDVRTPEEIERDRRAGEVFADHVLATFGGRS